ncbi:hypothetical protein, partial [Frankia sp. AvcI1]|uniref:hypothetical protein n=1 Tax=Frankia sp. AvcI1 TaxID=573496 RepID=UPI001F298FC3
MAQYLTTAGWTKDLRNYVDLRVWTGGGPGRSEQALEQFAAAEGVEVLVVNRGSRAQYDRAAGRMLVVNDRGQPTQWRALGPLAQRGLSKWVTHDGRVRLRPDDAVVRTSTGLTGTNFGNYLSTVSHSGELAVRDDVYELRGIEVQFDQAGAPWFVIRRLDAKLRALSPEQLPAYLEGHGWRPGQPLVIIPPGIVDDRQADVERQMWQRVGAAADVFVFA